MSDNIKKIEHITKKATCHFSGSEWKQKEVEITLHKEKRTFIDGSTVTVIKSISCPYIQNSASSTLCRNYIPPFINFVSSCRYEFDLHRWY